MKKQTKIFLVLGIILLLAVAYFYPRLGTQPAGEGAAPAGQNGGGNAEPLVVNVVQLKKETLNNQLQVSGTILPNESVDIKPEINGLVTKINFKEGQYVTKGTPLVYLNDNELQAQYQRLQYTQKLVQTQESRQKQLLAREAISQEEYDIVLNQYNTALSDIKLVQAQLEKTVIRAPFNGRLGLRQVSEGAVINASNIIVSIVSGGGGSGSDGGHAGRPRQQGETNYCSTVLVADPVILLTMLSFCLCVEIDDNADTESFATIEW